MSVLDRIKGWFTGSASQSAGSLLASILQSGRAPRRGSRELLIAYRTSPWLHSVMHRIAGEVAAVPLQLYSSPTRGAAERMKRRAVPADAQLVERHPLLDLLSNPNPVMTAGVLMYLVNAYLDMKGEAVLVIERNGAGLPAELWVVPPHWLVEPPSKASPAYRFGHMGWQRTIAETDVIWIRHPDLENPYSRGVGLVEAMADEIDIDQFATDHLKQWFFNRAMPDVFLYVEGVKSDVEAQRYEEKLRSKHGGRGKANQIHVTNGKVDVKTIGHTFREQMLPDLRDQSRDFILQLFSVPPEVMGIVENSNRATIDSAFYLFARVVVTPRLSFVCDALTSWCRAEYKDASLCVGFESPVPEDAEFRLRVMQAQPDLFQKNEWRKLAGLPPLEEFGDDLVSRPSPPALGLPAGTPAPADAEEDDDAEEPEDEEPEGRSARRSLRAVHAIDCDLDEDCSCGVAGRH